MEIHIFHIKIQLKCGLCHHIFREDNYMCANVQGFWILQFEDSIGYFLFLEFISHWIPNIHIFHIQKQNFTSSLPLWFWRKTLSVWAHLVKKVHGIRVQHIYDLIFVLVNITIPTHRWWNVTSSKNSKDIWIYVVIFGWKLQQVAVYITWIITPLCVVGISFVFLFLFWLNYWFF